MAHKQFFRFLLMTFTLSVAAAWLGTSYTAAAQNTGPVTEDEIEILASGPIHEAFAEAVPLDPEPGMEAPKEPPPLIEEMPPSQKPAGDVQWIPGYWAWDDERDDYIWVSGIWRVPPPSRQWVPGYWNQVAAGYQWISGYWGGVADRQVQYLPEPPASVEVGPSSHAPSPEHIWVPGCWIWQHGRYAWRAGYWAPVNPDWIWVPAHYSWTPRGYIFVGGYWDYTVIHRGILFAPVFFPPRVHLGLGFTFSPGFVIGLNIFDDALFLRPRYHHYYFGDYYAPGYYQLGIYPWFSLHARRMVYDPIFAHQRWHHRYDRQWETRLERTFRQRRDHVALRPPRTYDRNPSATTARRPEFRNMVVPLDRAGKDTSGARFQPLSEKERSDFTRQEKAVRTFERERRQREGSVRNSGKVAEPARTLPNRERTIQSPVTDRTAKSRERLNAPPQRYSEPAPNPNIEPLERRNQRVRPQSQSRTITPEGGTYREGEKDRPTQNSTPRVSNGNAGSSQRRISPQERTTRSERQR